LRRWVLDVLFYERKRQAGGGLWFIEVSGIIGKKQAGGGSALF